MKHLLAFGLAALLSPVFAQTSSIDWKACTPFCLKDIKDDTATLMSGTNKRAIPLSVISLQAARNIFNAQAADPGMSYGYVVDGGYARTHLLGKVLAASGTESGKVWVGGALQYRHDEFGTFRQSYRVATVVLVRQGKGVAPYVLDPVMQSEPVAYDVWRKAQSGLSFEVFSNRFPFGPEDLPESMKAYDEGSLAEAQRVNEGMLKRLATFRSEKALLRPLGLQDILLGECHAAAPVRRLMRLSAEAQREVDGKSPDQLQQMVQDLRRSGKLGESAFRTMALMEGLGVKPSAETIHTLLMSIRRDEVLADVGLLESVGNACERYVAGQYYIAEHYRKRQVTDGDHTTAVQWLRASADMGYQPAQEQVFQFYNLAERYGLKNPFSSVKPESVLKEYQDKAAAQGEEARGKVVAMTNLGMIYQFGTGVNRDMQQAVSWYQKAVDAGDGRAMAYLGRIYEFDGGGVIPASRDKALALYKKASDQGNGHGTQNYALLRYETPQGPADEKALTELLEKAVTQGFPQAVTKLYKRYRDGLGAEKNPEKAFVLLKTSAEQWMTTSIMAELITAHLTGMGTPVSKDRARAVYEECRQHPVNRECEQAWQAGKP